jgi:hypothetical protein
MDAIEGPAGVWLGVRMLAWSAVLPILKHVVPLRVLTRLMWAETRAIPRPQRERQVAFLARRIYRVRPVLRRDNCLERSLLLYRFLSREGLAPRLVLGAQKSDRLIVGHAWVKVAGRPVIDDHEALADYTPIAEFGAQGARVDES